MQSNEALDSNTTVSVSHNGFDSNTQCSSSHKYLILSRSDYMKEGKRVIKDVLEQNSNAKLRNVKEYALVMEGTYDYPSFNFFHTKEDLFNHFEKCIKKVFYNATYIEKDGNVRMKYKDDDTYVNILKYKSFDDMLNDLKSGNKVELGGENGKCWFTDRIICAGVNEIDSEDSNWFFKQSDFVESDYYNNPDAVARNFYLKDFVVENKKESMLVNF